jgi:hypothetical protein
MVTARRFLLLSLGFAILAVVALESTPRGAAALVPQRATGQSRSLPDVVGDEIVTRQAVCRWAAQPPVLDGKLDDRCWQHAAVIDHFGAFWMNPKAPRTGTFAYLVWDEDAIYYAGSMTDAELRSFGTKRNDTLWEGDVFELFLKPTAERPEYYEFQANPRAVVFEMAFAKRPDGPVDFAAAAPLGSRAAVALNGTLDQPGDRDQGWTVEGRIPWTAFAPTGGKPKPGDEWLFAICRYDYGPKDSSPILMSSAPLTKPSFHRYEDYGKLRFDGPRERDRDRIR